MKKEIKMKNIFKKETIMLLIITIVALVVRLLHLRENHYGLWMDEAITYLVSSKSFPLGILKTVWEKDYHMPLYYFYIHFWIKMFGNGDTILKLSSVLWGFLTIPAFYYLGKVYQSKQLGWLCSIIATLSPIMIFYSHELRFYSFLIFLSVISLTYFLKLIQSFSKKDLLIFLFVDFIILYIYTLGLIFVATECLILLSDFYLYNRKSLNSLIKYLCVFFVTIIPYLILLISFWIGSNKQLIEFFSSSNGLSKYTFLMISNDWFSPFICNTYYPVIGLYDSFFSSVSSFWSFFAKTFTSFIFIIGFIINVKFRLSKNTLYLLIILLIFLSTEVILSSMGHFIMLTRYTMMVWAIGLILSCQGLLLIKHKLLKIISISLIIITFICDMFNYKDAPGYQPQNGEILPIVSFVKEKQKDNYKKVYILYPYSSSEILKKYLKDINLIKYNINDMLYIDKTLKERYKLFDKQFILKTDKKNAFQELTPYLSQSEPTNNMKFFLNNSVYNLSKDSIIIFVIQTHINERYTQKQINSFIQLYKNGKISASKYSVLFYFMVEAKIFYDMKKVLDTNPSLRKIRGGENLNYKYKFYLYEKFK